MFEKHNFKRDKLSEEDKKKVEKRLNETGAELGKELKVEETPDMIAMELESKDGEKKKRWFMKSKEIALNDGYEKLEDMLEASAKFPDLSLTEAVKKLKAQKKEK